MGGSEPPRVEAHMAAGASDMPAVAPVETSTTVCGRLNARLLAYLTPSAEVLNLGLGNVLYLQYLRCTAILFLVVGIFSIPNIVTNMQGGRYTLATMPPVEYAATYASIANLGSATWTPGSDNACSGHGFAALACNRGGWDEPLADFECGSGNVSAVGFQNAGRLQFLFGTTTDCSDSAQRTVCVCYPGYEGKRCERGSATAVVTYGSTVDANSSQRSSSWWTPPSNSSQPTNYSGFCMPLFDWRDPKNATGTSVLKNAAPLEDARDPRSCSGHGQCVVRYVEKSLAQDSAAPELAYTFCSCDAGFWGTDCSNPTDVVVSGKPRNQYGDFYNRVGTNCKTGVTPVQTRGYISDLINRPLPSIYCSKHGFPWRLPSTPDGFLLEGSSYYRAQTPGVCMCEPGYSGEQCMGGKPVPDQEGWFTAVGTLVLLGGLMALYRQRKIMQQSYDDSTVSPSDFSVFVDKLPPLDVVRDVGDVKAHFEQFGPVHSVACACDDEDLVSLQVKRDKALLELQIVSELEEAQRRVKAGMAGALPVRLPRPSGEELAAEVRAAAPLTPRQLKLAMSPLGRKLLRVDRALLLGVIQHLDRKLAEERAKPCVRTFERCFITFDHSADADKCLDAYSTAATNGIFGERPKHGSELLFRGSAAITVAQASEPDEVQWDALDEGAGEILKRRSLTFFLLLVMLLVLYLVVQALESSKDSWPPSGFQRQVLDFLGTLAIVVLNLIVGNVYKAVAFYEQHYNKGSFVRSVYLKTLLTQLFTSALAATLGVFNFPLDLKNGYIQDWYATAGPFIFRLSLIESVLPPILAITNPKWRLLSFLASRSPSATAREKGQRPPGFMLAKASAALLRTVIMCAGFNAGLPVLNFVVASGLGIRYLADKWLLINMFRLQRTGPELARSLEVSLMFAIVINAVMCWATIMAAWFSSRVTLAILFVVVVNVIWALSGYFSWKLYRGSDCWAGSGPIVPCSAWLCNFNERVLAPFHAVHRVYMKAVFGSDFFEKEEDLIDETGGRTYTQCVELDPTMLRVHPYFLPERVAACPELYGSVGASATKPPSHLTGAKLKALAQSQSRRGADMLASPALSGGGALGRASSSEQLPTAPVGDPGGSPDSAASGGAFSSVNPLAASRR